MQRFRRLISPHYMLVASLIVIWVMALAALPSLLPLHLASWLAFIALLIVPGYLLGDIITWKLNLDVVERLALALPLGVAILAVPGIISLLYHLDIHQLALGWAIASGIVIVAWLFHEAFTYQEREHNRDPWKIDEILLMGLLLIAFVAILPTLNLYKIDGDAFAVNSFSADAIAGLPLNETEPIFGTDLGPGVRMVFNQSLSLYYLWSYFSVIDANSLIATASKGMLALWAIFASYTLGKAAGKGSRRFGLLTASIQLLIYMAAPFIRGDNVSLFYFERINADKFMVPVTMLPVIFALAISFIRDGGWRTWLAAAIATLAVSTIHPLIAAMLALSIGAFGAVHLLMNLRYKQSWIRVLTLYGLIVIVMFLPLVQLVLAQGEAPLASSYPNTVEDWDVGAKQVPILPFVHAESLDYYGRLPEIEEMEAGDVYESTNPFLIWRFALNMDRRRLILFDLNNYISDPSLIMEPPYFLALLLLPMFIFLIRRDVATQFVFGVSIGVLVVMFSPLITPLIGSFVMPWILWRFVWILPYALIFAMAANMIMNAAIRLVAKLQRMSGVGDADATTKILTQYGTLVFLLATALLFSPGILRNINNLSGRIAFAYSYPTPEGIFSRLNAELAANEPAMVIAEQDLSVTIPAYVANAHVLAHRMPTTSEVFPADQQDIALQRLIDQDNFFKTPYLTESSINSILKYDAGYVIVQSGSDLDLQLRMAPSWFERLENSDGFTLYAVIDTPVISEAIQGNAAMARHDWFAAKDHFDAALEKNKNDLLALMGKIEIAQREGQFDVASEMLEQSIAHIDAPILHYKMGQLLAKQGRIEESIAEFDLAQEMDPAVGRFHIALGDACLSDGMDSCASEQYREAVSLGNWPDKASRLIAEADIWRQRGFTDRARPLYEEAARLQSNEYNLFVLISVYRELEMFDAAMQLIRSMRVLYPLSAEVISVQADLEAAQRNYDAAISLLRHAIWLQELQVQETTDSHLALAQVFLDAGRIEDAGNEIAYAVSQNPYSAVGHTLRGDFFRARDDRDAAIRAYQRAFELDPTLVGVYVALSEELRQNGGTPRDVMVLLQIALGEASEESTLLLALGDQWQRLGDAEAAIDAYHTAAEQLTPYGRSGSSQPLASADSQAFALARIASTYEDLGQTQAAMNYYHSAAVAAPAAAWPQLLLGDVQRRQNNVEEAIAAYENALSLENDLPEAYIRLADLYSAQGELERAQSLYQRALDLTNPALAQADPARTFTAQRLGTPTFNAALASDESLYQTAHARSLQAKTAPVFLDNDNATSVMNPNDVFALAQIYQGQRRGDEALQLYLQRLEEGRKIGEPPAILARYHKEIGDLYLVRYELDEAIAAYRESIRLDNWSPAARLGLAEALTLKGKPNEAIVELERAVSLSPGAVEAQIALANILDNSGKPTEAMTIYVNTARNHPGNGQATLALARAWQARNRSDMAEKSFQDTIEKNPGSADAYVGLAELHMDVNELEDAEIMLLKAKSIDYNNVSSYIRLGELEQRRGNSEEALAWYQLAATLPAADQTLNLTLIDSLIRYGDYDTALSYTNRALLQRPNDGELLMRRGRIERIFGQYTESLDSFSQAQAQDPDNSLIYLELANLYLNQGRVDGALASYEQAIELEPEETTYYVTASQLWVTQDQPERAQELLLEGISQVADPVSLYSTLAAVQLQQGQPESALQTLTDGVSELGESTEMFLAMGDYFVNRGNFEQVKEQFDQALESQPDVADVHAALGDLHMLMEEPEMAIDQYRKAIAIDPATPGHYLALGDAFQAHGSQSQALEAYRQAIATAPTLIDGYLDLANIYQALGNWTDASKLLDKGLTVAPASGELLIQYATLQLSQGNRAEAFDLLEDAVDIAPTASTYIRRAELYAKLGKLDDARNDLEAALTIEPATVEALVALGDIYREKGEDPLAEEYFLRAAKVMPGVPTGYLRMATMARAAENRDAVVYWNDLARQAEPGGLARPEEPIIPEE